MTTLTPDADASIYSENGGVSDSLGPHLFAGRLKDRADFRRALLYFDLSSIPSQAVIQSATLQLTVLKSPSGTPLAPVGNLHPVLNPWTEGTSNAGSPGGQGTTATPNDPTWTFNSFNSSLWTTAGGDFGSSSASAPLGTTGATPTFSSAGMVADLQSWLTNPSQNFGWILIGDESLDSSARRFGSAENDIADFRPQLSITYTVPEPSTFTAIILGSGMCLLLRSRITS